MKIKNDTNVVLQGDPLQIRENSRTFRNEHYQIESAPREEIRTSKIEYVDWFNCFN